MFSLSKKIFFSSLFILIAFFSFFSFASKTHAESSELQAVESRRAELEQELANLEKEIAEKQAILDGQKQKSASLTRDIGILKTKIEKAKLDIKSQNLIIKKLTEEIGDKVKTIETLSEKIEKGKDSLAQLIRKTNEIDENTIVHIVLSTQTLSDFYSDLDSFSSINNSLEESVNEVKTVKKNTENEKDKLKKKQDEEINAKAQLESFQRQIEKNQKDQKQLLSISKNKEKEYQKIVAERAKKAAEIRAALFALRDTAAIPFGKALEYATAASQKTGVRPAFILAVLTQESNLGQNIGTCNRASDPPEKHWQTIMKPSRDQASYLRITEALGLNPDTMPLSCPWGGGWGGAMGPSQFIPSTWEMYKSKIASALGISTPNPWEPRDAFMATAIYMKELGASAQTYTAERTAALKYYAGSNWAKSSNAFYGNEVMAKAIDIQENMIDPLNGV